MTMQELEQRVLALEASLQRLLLVTPVVDKSDPKWVLATAGQFKDDPAFEEMVRLGREWREAQRPGRKKKAAKPRKKKAADVRP